MPESGPRELCCPPQQMLVEVCDRGPGSSAEYAERVSMPFYRIEPSRSRATGGVGLGLTSARAASHGRGGVIMLGNRIAGDLEVQVTLPMLWVSGA